MHTGTAACALDELRMNHHPGWAMYGCQLRVQLLLLLLEDPPQAKQQAHGNPLVGVNLQTARCHQGYCQLCA